MATVTISITSTTYSKAKSASVEAGVDYLNITTQQASSGALYGLNGNAVSISGCSYTRYAVGTKYVYGLSGYPSSDAVGTYTLGMARITSTGTKSSGADITLTVGNYYYSTLKYDANTGSGAPDTQQDKSEIVTAQPSAYTHTISSTTPTLSGYAFKGWSTTQYTPGTGTAQYQPGDTITVSYSISSTSGATLYAVWGKSVDGGIEWVKDDTTKTLTIKPTDTPETGYTSGQMKDHSGDAPWGTIADSGWTLDIQSGVTNIGDQAFTNCSGFTGSLAIPDTVTTIGYYSFQECTGFTGALVIPNNVTSIGDGAFARSTGFTSLTIGDGVTSIGGSSFYNLFGVTGTITIPATVTSIGIGAFMGCYAIDGMKFNGSEPTFGDYALAVNTRSGSTATYLMDSSFYTASNPVPTSISSTTIWIYPKSMYIKVNGSWVSGTPFVKVGGVWKQGTPYIKVDGVWK